MNIAASILEIAVIVLGVVIMLADLWIPRDKKNWLGYASIAGLALILFDRGHPRLCCLHRVFS